METAKACGVNNVPMKKQLEQAYEELLSLLGLEVGNRSRKVSRIIKEEIERFVKNCKIPALWCYGEHTRMLMTDYIFEMRRVKYIIDEFYTGDSGFEVITSEKIGEKEIDGIIISTYKYRKEIVETIRSRYPQMKYLDIYEKLYENGIDLSCEYYAENYPYARYARINRMNCELWEQKNVKYQEDFVEDLVKEFVLIKDFSSAIRCMEEALRENHDRKMKELLKYLYRIYRMELQAASVISKKNVLMLCIDGLRRQDLFSGEMERVKRFILYRGYSFTNAYSASTSTYESLIPAYSGNNDLSTRYYEKNEIEEEECPFIKEAIKQERKIRFYTDSCHYVKSKHIVVTESYQTAAEKLWDFLLDAVDEKNGLFYVHILYESHYSYPNPYTKGALVTEGTNILFDFLSRNGGKLKTDYVAQHRDTLRYLDDLLAPILEQLCCKMIIYADHGNVLLGKNAELGDVSYPQLTFGEELIQVPLVICDEETGVGISDKICSLMDLNNMLICLLQGKAVKEIDHAYVKVVRSALYNADFQYLYQKIGCERGSKAFEVFLFQEGYKLVVYEDGVIELYNSASDEKISDIILKKNLLAQIEEMITVWT